MDEHVEEQIVDDPYDFNAESEESMELRDENSEESFKSDDNEATLPRPRKRKRNEHLQKRTIMKDKVNRGLERVTPAGKVIPARTFEGVTICKCNPCCSNMIDIEQQKNIHSAYYEEMDHRAKTFFLRENVQRSPVKSHKYALQPIMPLRKRDYVYCYSFKNEQGLPVRVCKDFFMKCLKEKVQRVYRAVGSASENPSAIDNRGRHAPKNKVPEEAKDGVRKFIRRLPTYESHYGRTNSEKKYLPPGLNIMILYREYQEWCKETSDKKVSKSCFYNIFNTEFNLAFKKRHSDTCKECDHWKRVRLDPLVSENEKIQIKEKHEKHIALTNKMTAELATDIKQATEDRGKMVVLTFDLQKALETPKLTTSIAYYKRTLWTYNLGIHDEMEKKGYMYVWPESMASRGGQEIGSCILYHLRQKIPVSTERVILYSDSCGGQNRNIKVSLLLKHFLANSNIESIEQKFFVSGHSYNSCDRDFGVIEKESKLEKKIETPDDWVTIILKAKKKDPKFEVTTMEKRHFVSSRELEYKITNRKVDEGKNRINWLESRQLRYTRDEPFKIFMTNNGESTQVLNIQRRDVSREEFEGVSLTRLYPYGRPITKAKYIDLQTLKQYIATEHHEFYEDLRHDEKAIDTGLASGASDNE